MVKTLFDPHYHTIYSDGKSKIIESIEAAKRKHLAVLIITDHLNWQGYMNSYRTGKSVMKRIRPEPQAGHFPVIIGTELALPKRIGTGHILLFGTEICSLIQQDLAEYNKLDIQELKRLKDTYECALVQSHPPKEAKGADERLLSILDACEITRKGHAHHNYKLIQKDCERHGITPIASSDGHAAYRNSQIVNATDLYLGKAYNIATIDITNEKDLIKVIKENLIEEKVFTEQTQSDRNF